MSPWVRSPEGTRTPAPATQAADADETPTPDATTTDDSSSSTGPASGDGGACGDDNAPCTAGGGPGLCKSGVCTQCADVTDDTNCTSAYGNTSSPFLCLSGVCSTGNCRSATDCATASGGSLCGVGTPNLCGKCTSDAQCAALGSAAPVCNLATGQCVAATCNTLSTSVADGTYAFTSYAGFYLDDPSAGGAGTGVDKWAYTGSNQQWTVAVVSGGQYKILAQNGLALTAGSGTGVQLTLQTYTGATTQLWGFSTNGSYYNIVNVASCLAMEDEGGGTTLPIAVDATTFSNQTDNNQKWTLTTSSSITAPIATGTYEFLDAAAYALDDSNGGGAGTAVGQWIYSPGSNQKWTVTLVSGVQYKIIGDGGAALTATTGNGQLPTLSAYTGGSDQLWVFVPNGSSYNVINVGSYVALDDDSGGQGVQCNQSAWSTTAASQQWSIGAAPQTACSQISVTTNTYRSSTGQITWKNTGTIAETNPQITFTIPSNATLNTSGCAFGSQVAPGCSAVSCYMNGTVNTTYAFLGSLAAGASITVYYTTQNSSESAATSIAITANSCQ